MRKTSVYLSDEDASRLAALAASEGMSQSDLIRAALQQYIPRQRGDRHFALLAVAEGPGGSIADVPDDELLDGFGE